MDTIEEDIIEIARNISSNKPYIDGNTRLYHDLGIAGDDMSELLMALHKIFGTSFRELPYEQYYSDELDAFFDFILSKVKLGSKWTPLTIAHLAQVVKSGSWFDPQYQERLTISDHK